MQMQNNIMSSIDRQHKLCKSGHFFIELKNEVQLKWRGPKLRTNLFKCLTKSSNQIVQGYNFKFETCNEAYICSKI